MLQKEISLFMIHKENNIKASVHPKHVSPVSVEVHRTFLEPHSKTRLKENSVISC